MKKIIYDGDGGGDEMQVATVLLAHQPDVTVLGATSVYGNTVHDQVLQNMGDILYLLGHEGIPYFPGAKGPTDGLELMGDNAHGNNGLGGVILPVTPMPAEDTPAFEFILETLRAEPRGTVTLIATGPLTNLALALQKEPETMAKVANILIMGGCTRPIPAADMPSRRGNITPFAEFNFYMAANDAKTVLESGLPITLFPMNCTQQLSVTPERCLAIQKAFVAMPHLGHTLVALISAPAALDKMKFGAAPFMHDIHTALYAIRPDLYQGGQGSVYITTEGAEMGRSTFRPHLDGNITVMENLLNPDWAFSLFLNSLKTVFKLALPQSISTNAPAPT